MMDMTLLPLADSTMMAERTDLPLVTMVTNSHDQKKAPGSIKILAPNYAMTKIVRDIVNWENLTNVGIFYDETFGE